MEVRKVTAQQHNSKETEIIVPRRHRASHRLESEPGGTDSWGYKSFGMDFPPLCQRLFVSSSEYYVKREKAFTDATSLHPARYYSFPDVPVS